MVITRDRDLARTGDRLRILDAGPRSSARTELSRDARDLCSAVRRWRHQRSTGVVALSSRNVPAMVEWEHKWKGRRCVHVAC
jgi:hypothetical protein